MRGKQQSHLMGSRSLANYYEQKLDSWRKTIQLFHYYNNPKFRGPFLTAGFRDYKIESRMGDTMGGGYDIDIVSSNEESWIIVEITTNGNSKEPKLDKYCTIHPSYLGNYGLEIPNCGADVMTARSQVVNDGPYCQIIVGDNLEVKNEKYIKYDRLRLALSDVNGVDLSKLPSLSITLLPEFNMSDVRKGIFDQVMQLFEGVPRKKRSMDIVDEALDKIRDKITGNGRQILIEKVQRLMDGLVKNELRNYLDIDKFGYYYAKESCSNHPSTLKKVTGILKDWAGFSNPQSKLFDF